MGDSNKNCPICNGLYKDASNVFLCPDCGLWFSGQEAGYGNPIQGMESLARHNYHIVASALGKQIELKGASVLDVGCAEGGFTEIMLSKGAIPLGLEPDKDAAEQAISKRLPIELASFEDYQCAGHTYDAVVFNDVFEHMQDPIAVMNKATRIVKNGGIILVNAPVSTGFIFAVARMATRLGIDSPWKRMWAWGLSSPHIYFYQESNLSQLMERYGCQLVSTDSLLALSTDGMYERVRTTYSPIPAKIISTIAKCVALCAKTLPADVRYFIFRKK